MLLNPPAAQHPKLIAMLNRHPEFNTFVLFVDAWIDYLDQFDQVSLIRLQSISKAVLKTTYYYLTNNSPDVWQLRYLFNLRQTAIMLNMAAGLSVPGSDYQIAFNSAAASLIGQFDTWDEVKQSSPSFDVYGTMTNIVNGLSVNTSSTSTSSTTYVPDLFYSVKSSDTLQQIALNLTGSADNWDNIRQYNSLSYPFISDNPRYQYGDELQTGSIPSGGVASGVTVLTIPNMNAQLIVKGMLFYLEKFDPSLGQVYETVAIDSYDNGTSKLTLQVATKNSYPQGSTWIVFDVPMNVTTRVVQTGGIIRVPGAIVNTENFINANADFAGTDIALVDGQMQFQNGDLLTVSKWDNITQAIENRFKTELGDLVYYPNYGNMLKQFMGKASGKSLAFIQYIIRTMLLQDPRITAVQNISAYRTDDQLQVSANVYFGNTSQALEFQVA